VSGNVLGPDQALPNGWREDEGRELQPNEVFFFAGGFALVADKYECEKVQAFVVPCSVCNKPAQELDHLFPYFWDQNYCDKCSAKLRAQAKKSHA